MKKVLIVEDDYTKAELEKNCLQLSNFDVTIETDTTKGEKLAMSGEYDMLLLDIKLSEGNGFDICRKYREKFLAPVILIADEKQEHDVIRGFAMGADDYIVKSVSPSELVARVTAHLKRYDELMAHYPVGNDDTNKEIKIGSLRIDKITRRVFVEEIEKRLTVKEYELLCFLASSPNRVFSKEELYKKIWGYHKDDSDCNTVAVHIKKIREKIEQNPSEPKLIKTVWAQGYRLQA